MLHFGKNKPIERNYTGKRLTEQTPFAVQEAFRAMRANISYATAGAGKHIFGMTSAHAGEGKSIVVANLAISFAMLEKKVLLIDADMRCPVQQEIFGAEVAPEQKGLTEYLAGLSNDVNECTVQVQGGLSLIPCGKIPPNPAELLASARMQELLASLADSFDYIFVDLPPICEVSDAAMISASLNGYFLVTRAGHCEARELARAEEALRGAGARLCGVILNDATAEKGAYYSKHYYGYGAYDQSGRDRNKKRRSRK